MLADIGRITWVATIRDIWPREADDFTPWLRQNIAHLDDCLGLGLGNARMEEPAGNFRVDIVADSNHGTILIENQFGKSDHKHLGQLITYLAVKDSQNAIWIAEDPREEHIQAVNILNERGIGAVWFVKVEGIQIEDSKPAPLFTVIAGPDPSDTPEHPEMYKVNNERLAKAYRFWVSLFENAGENNLDIPHRRLNTAYTQQLLTPAIGQEVMYILAVNRGTARILCQNRRRARLRTYDYLVQNQSEIDKAFRASGLERDLEWKDPKSAGAWSIKYEVKAGYEDDSNSAVAMAELNQAAVALKKSLDPYLKEAPADEAEEPPD